MTSPLNGRIEVGVRVLVILSAAYPQHMDMNRLVLLDHALLHSEDLGGPQSIHPPVPIRAGELSVKRAVIKSGIEAMYRARLVEIHAGATGIEFSASDEAHNFVSILTTDYANELKNRVVWALDRFGDATDSDVRAELQTAFSHWVEEFWPNDSGLGRIADA